MTLTCPSVMSIAVACIVGHFCGHDFKDMLSGMIERLSASMEAVLILCTVGFLSRASWPPVRSPP